MEVNIELDDDAKIVQYKDAVVIRSKNKRITVGELNDSKKADYYMHLVSAKRISELENYPSSNITKEVGPTRNYTERCGILLTTTRLILKKSAFAHLFSAMSFLLSGPPEEEK